MSFVPGKIDSLWDKVVVPRILEQYKYAENWKFCLKCVIDGLQKVENGSFAIARYFRVPTSFDEMSSENLEYVAALVNVFRKEGESDQQLFERFVLRISSTNSGTPDYVIFNAVKMSGDPKVNYFDEAPATFFVSPFGGEQLSRAQVKKLAPSGALGLPAAMMCDGGLNPMATYDGTLMCCVARDENIGKIYEEVLEIGGLRYKTVKIGNQEWMAENLQLEVPNSWFFNDDEATYGRNGKNYGRLYTWDAAMKIVVPGWHIPSRAEWEQLADFAGEYTVAGTKLMSRSLGGTDDFGFNSYLCGMKNTDDDEFDFEGDASYFISSSSTGRYTFDGMSLSNSWFLAEDFGKSYAYSVRLVKD